MHRSIQHVVPIETNHELPCGSTLTAHIGVAVAANLEGIARARLEKKPRQYQSDAAVHQACIHATSGGGNACDGEDAGEAEPSGEAPQKLREFFEPLPWDISTGEEMQKVLDFGHRVRLTPFAKELMTLPCMKPGVVEHASNNDVELFERASRWRQKYAGICNSTEQQHIDLVHAQAAHKRR